MKLSNWGSTNSSGNGSGMIAICEAAAKPPACRGAEVEVELGQASAVRSPYSGTVKKVKVKGQTGNLMEVEMMVVPREE